jgi:hypothetical protein
LAGDIGIAGFALRIEGVEFLLQALIGGFARIDRAAALARERRGCRIAAGHALAFRKPKNSQPFQRVPVMARAMAESD